MRRAITATHTLVTVLALAALISTTASTTARVPPVAAAPKVSFSKQADNPMPQVGEAVVFTLQFSSHTVAPIWVRVSDPNPAPQYLEILPSTITGGAWYSPTIDGVVWEDMLLRGDEPTEVTYQVRVLGVPELAPPTGYVITNTATIADLVNPGSLPEQIAQTAIRIGAPRVWIPLASHTLPLKGQHQPAATAAKALPPVPGTPSTRYFLPLASYGGCPAARSVVSPFSLEIAAMHEIREGAGGANHVAHQAPGGWSALSEETFRTLLEALEESGAGWTRVRIAWNQIQPDPPPAAYQSLPWYDERLALVAGTGVQLIATVADTPGWAADLPCAPIHADRLDAFGQFLTDMVNRYQGPPYNIHHWELFNEPDGTWVRAGDQDGGLGCWANANTDDDGRAYVQMLAAAHRAIKAADPEATILMGGVAHDWFTEYGGPFDRYFPDDVMQHGGGAYVDTLNLHYFRDWHAEWDRWDPGSEERQNGWLPAPTCGDLFDGEGMAYEAWGLDLHAKATHFANRMSVCFGVDVPLWVTELAEHGYAGNPASLERQARYVIRGYVRGLAAGVANITWYALTTPNDTYGQGLLYSDWSPKPAFYAYQTLTAQLAGYEYAYTLDAQDGEGYLFRDPCGQEKTVAWGSGTLRFESAAAVDVVGRTGMRVLIRDGGEGDLDGAQDGALELQLSTDPVFVSIRR